MISIKLTIQWYIIQLYLISKFFPLGAPAKILPFWIYLILGNCSKATEWHSLVLQPGVLVKIIPSKKIHAYATFRFHPVVPGLIPLLWKHVFDIYSESKKSFWQNCNNYLHTSLQVTDLENSFHPFCIDFTSNSNSILTVIRCGCFK